MSIRWPDEVAGLPLHPLVVHAAVVLIPLAALGLLVMASSGARSKRYSPVIVFVAVVAALAAFVSRWSGEQLRLTEVVRADRHFTYGAYLPWVALALMVIVIILALMDRQGGGRRNAVGTIVALLGIVVALGAIVGTVIVGHSGAELVWG
ncbi:MAG: DUF2231 domain-containing protein [Candidatus Nanopelagicales bacterium]